jgi:aspartate 1-decarboxylase
MKLHTVQVTERSLNYQGEHVEISMFALIDISCFLSILSPKQISLSMAVLL